MLSLCRVWFTMRGMRTLDVPGADALLCDLCAFPTTIQSTIKHRFHSGFCQVLVFRLGWAQKALRFQARRQQPYMGTMLKHRRMPCRHVLAWCMSMMQIWRTEWLKVETTELVAYPNQSGLLHRLWRTSLSYTCRTCFA